MRRKWKLYRGDVEEKAFEEAMRFPYYRVGLRNVLAWGERKEAAVLKEMTDRDLSMLSCEEKEWLKCCIDDKARALGKRMTKSQGEKDRHFLKILEEELEKEADILGNEQENEHQNDREDGHRENKQEKQLGIFETAF